jgi:hypothetical protein
MSEIEIDLLRWTRFRCSMFSSCWDDWTFFAGFLWEARDLWPGADRAAIRELVLGMIRELLEEDLIVIGELAGEGGDFDRWAMPVEEAIGHVVRGWEALGDEVGPWEVAWFTTAANARRSEERRRLRGMGEEVPRPRVEPASYEAYRRRLLTVCGRRWTGFWEFVWHAWDLWEGIEDEERRTREVVERLVGELLREERVVVGEVSGEGEFRAWGVSVEEAVGRIMRGWEELGEEPVYENRVAWFATPELLEKGRWSAVR